MSLALPNVLIRMVGHMVMHSVAVIRREGRKTGLNVTLCGLWTPHTCVLQVIITAEELQHCKEELSMQVPVALPELPQAIAARLEAKVQLAGRRNLATGKLDVQELSTLSTCYTADSCSQRVFDMYLSRCSPITTYDSSTSALATCIPTLIAAHSLYPQPSCSLSLTPPQTPPQPPVKHLPLTKVQSLACQPQATQVRSVFHIKFAAKAQH